MAGDKVLAFCCPNCTLVSTPKAWVKATVALKPKQKGMLEPNDPTVDEKTVYTCPFCNGQTERRYMREIK